MPRSSFGVGMLDSATPGLSRLAQSLAGGSGAYDTGYDKGMTAQSKIAQAMAAIRASEAAAAAHDSIARQNDAETNVLTNRGPAIDERVAASTGTTLPIVQAVQQYIRTGQRPMNPAMGPAEEDGTQAAQFPTVDDATQSKVGQALARSLVLRTNLKDTTPDSLAKANDIYREGDIQDKVYSGEITPQRYGTIQYAAKGQAPFHLGAQGEVLNNFSGGVDTSNPLATANVGLIGEKGKTEKATQAERYAQAGHANALTTKTRQEVEQGVKAGYLKLEHDADGNIVVVDLSKGTATAATDPTTGLPVKGKTAADKPLTETQGKATTFAARMLDAETAIQALEAQGIKGSDFRTRAAASDWTNFLASPQGQQYRQAQENWVTANLRQESGAAIGVNEMAKDVRKFFPTIGDSPEVMQQKSQARMVAQRGMMEQAGPGAKRVAGIVNGPAGPAPAAAPAPSNVVHTPDGQTHTFPNAQAAAAFRKAAGLP